MPKYEIEFKHLLERTVTCFVEADSEEEAIEKAQDGEYEDYDEDSSSEQGIETGDYTVVGVID